MSWLFSQVLVEEFLQENSLDGERSALLNGTHMQQAFCSPDKMTEFCRLSRFGMMFKPLMEHRGKELLMWFQGDFPAKTSALPGEGRASKENEVGCGDTWHASLAKYDQNSRSWKTRQCLLFEDSGESLEIWPKWGMTHAGECWAETPLDSVATETGYGLSLMRPIASDGLRHRFKLSQLVRTNHQDGNLSEQLARVHQVKLTPLACEILMDWPETWSELKPLEMDKFLEWLN